MWRPSVRGLRSAWPPFPASRRWRRWRRIVSGSFPSATCGRKRRRPSWGPAGACCGSRSRSRASRRSTPIISREPARESAMRREGSALHGFGVVTLKEIADHFTSILVVVLVVLVTATAIAVVRGAIDQIKEITAEDPFLFLRLFTRGGPLPLVALLSFLVPLVAIGLGFDAVNGEHNRRTLSRILAQPIYRDALLFGKFAAGLFTLSVSLIVLWLLVIGLGLLGLGVPPNAEEMSRALILLVGTIAYAVFSVALAVLCSALFRSAATAALVSLGLWLFSPLLLPLFFPAL